MILLFPLVVAIALVVVARRHHEPGGEGAHWFAAWAVAGALLTFSFLTGFSIGLLLLPVAAAATVLVASRAPHWREVTGFIAGLGAVLLLVAALNRGDDGVDATPWLVAGCLLAAVAVGAYTAGSGTRR
jgi:hypothetical protein